MTFVYIKHQPTTASGKSKEMTASPRSPYIILTSGQDFSKTKKIIRLEDHDKVLAIQLLYDSEQSRRLKRYHPLDLPFRFN